MMMKKFETLRRIVDSGLVAVIRADSADQAIQLAEACHKGGVAAIEVAFTVHGADEAIRELSRRFSRGEFVLGAGTVLDPETARMAMLAGAQYVVTPALNEATVRLCNRYQIPCIPGAMTVEEVLRAMECGADIVKLFPGELFGPSAIRAIRGPLPQANLLPTGGVNLDNVSAHSPALRSRAICKQSRKPQENSSRKSRPPGSNEIHHKDTKKADLCAFVSWW